MLQLTKRLLESALEGEMTDQLGYDKHDPGQHRLQHHLLAPTQDQLTVLGLPRFSGELSPDFRWPDPDRTDDPLAILQVEGVRFDSKGRASADQRLTAVELAAFADLDVDVPEAQQQMDT